MRKTMYHSSHRRTKSEDRLGIIFTVGAFLGIVGIVVAVVFNMITRTEIDPQTLCPIDGPPTITVVLFDRSDALSVPQQEAMRRHLHLIKEGLVEREKLVIHLVNDTANQLLTPVFSTCNPGRGEGLSYWSANPKKIKQDWDKKFSNKVDQVISDMLQPSSMPHSRIMESIQSVVITDFMLLRDSSKKLVIVSDMLQNTPEHSQYRGITPFSAFKSSAYYRRVQTNLDGVEVKIFYVNRGAAHANHEAQHIDFWRHYFYDMGGRLTRVERL